MEVLYVFPEPIPLPRARGVQVAHSVAALARAGVGVVFAYVPAGPGDPFRHYGIARPDNIRLVPLARGLPRPFAALKVHSNRLFLWRLARWLHAARRTGRAPQLIFARHLKAAHGLLKTFPGMPLIYEAHEVFGDTAPAGKQGVTRGMESFVTRSATVVIANSRATAERLRALYGVASEIPVVPNGVTLPGARSEKDWSQIGRAIVYAGSFFSWKGVQDLVTAAGELPGCRITLIGGSPEQIERLRPCVKPGGAEIVFLGHLSHEETLRQLGRACIAVLPNRAEPDSAFTCPIKLFEYMAAGCAVVATDLPSVREIIGAHDAAWAEPGNPSAIARAIHVLVKDADLARRMGERLHAIAGRYTWDARAARLKEIISGAVNARN